MNDTPPSSRPKIEVVRVSSMERAKIKPLLEGGIQLEAQFQHMRYGDYASYSSLEDANKQCYSFQYHDYMDRKAPKATKSLDNIFARQLTGGRDEQGSPFLWRDATRSEEHLYSGSLQQSEPASQPSTPSRFSVARSRISALIKKLSPRPFHKAVPATSSCPWVIVEFANQDLESPIVSGRTSSITSDHSFDLAVRANRLRKEKMVHGSEEQIHKKSGVSTHVLDIRHQSHIPQVSSVGADRHSKHDEQRRYRLTTGLATKHRPAFNTGSNRQVSGGTAAAKVKAKVAATSRPHTLHIQHQRKSSMASNDSIGSCSLDVDATASDISECVDAGTVSARTLRSLQLSTKTPDPGGLTTDSSGGASTPEYVKRTARLFETTENAGAGNHSTRAGKTSEIPSVIVVNGSSSNKVGDNLSEVSCTGKKPSYLGLACSISGYSGITTYDSKLREGFRSRDHSPGRIGIIKSRDVSPLRSFSEQSENNLTPTYKSDCGNFLVAPLMKGSHNAEKGGNVSPRKGDSNNIPTVRPGNVSGDVSTNAGGNQIGLSHVNGDYKLVKKVNDIQIPESLRTMGDEKKYSSIVDQSVNGVSMAADDSNKRHLGSSRFAESYSGSMKEEFFSNSSSNIRESTRNFMSSMLTTDSSYSSTHYESCSIQSTSKSRDVTDFCSPLKNSPLTSVPRDGFGAFSPVKRSPDSPKTAARDSPGSRVTSSPRDSSGFSSPMKPSPDSPKTSSKDSLSAPTSTSPQKRSPGAVRVVEFTSQTKSYVRTAFVSGNSMESPFSSQGFPDSSQSKGFADGIQTTYIRNVRSGPTEGEACSDSAVAQTNGSSSDAVWTTKSFIQQRVERLYGPGALAQGFFRRVRHKPPDETQSLSEGHVSQNGTRSNSNPSLPVLRHLRPEFRAQLSLGTRRLQGCEEPCSAVEEVTSEVIDRRSSVEIPILQQQISVESLKESITDLQPAAPEVVLPIDQPQSVSCQPTGQPECSGDVVSENSQEKDGHYFLKLLKQEIDRLNGLVEVAEADLANGEALPEEALGKLRAASGQARLLIRQKLQQFEGLCHKNIAQSSEEPFPTTCEDLAGFWDMVMLQVEHVNSLFEEITKLRAANWVEVKVPSKSVTDGVPKRKTGSGTKRSSAPPTKTSASSEAARKAREENRRKMMEERRKAMKEKKDAGSSGQVEIFVPQENGK